MIAMKMLKLCFVVWLTLLSSRGFVDALSIFQLTFSSVNNDYSNVENAADREQFEIALEIAVKIKLASFFDIPLYFDQDFD